MKRHHLLAAAAVVALAGSLTACGSGSDASPSSGGSAGSVDAKTAADVTAFGGMDKLVEAAKAEGKKKIPPPTR